MVDNIGGMREVYRGGKAALDTFMRSFAARHSDDARAMAAMAPGWVQTDVGGPQARLTIAGSLTTLVNVLIGVRGRAGLQ